MITSSTCRCSSHTGHLCSSWPSVSGVALQRSVFAQLSPAVCTHSPTCRQYPAHTLSHTHSKLPAKVSQYTQRESTVDYKAPAADARVETTKQFPLISTGFSGGGITLTFSWTEDWSGGDEIINFMRWLHFKKQDEMEWEKLEACALWVRQNNSCVWKPSLCVSCQSHSDEKPMTTCFELDVTKSSRCFQICVHLHTWHHTVLKNQDRLQTASSLVFIISPSASSRPQALVSLCLHAACCWDCGVNSALWEAATRSQVQSFQTQTKGEWVLVTAR